MNVDRYTFAKTQCAVNLVDSLTKVGLCDIM